jgi:hypothetical protein
MKDYYLLAVIMLCTLTVSSQTLKGDTLTLEDGLTYWKGMEVQVGVGTDEPAGKYKSLYIGSKWTAKNNLNADWKNRKMKVAGFQNVTMNRGYGPIDQYILVLNAGKKIKVFCDIEEAQSNGEIVENREGTVGPPPGEN